MRKLNPYKLLLVLFAGVPLIAFVVYATVVIIRESQNILLRTWIASGVVISLVICYLFLISLLSDRSKRWDERRRRQ